jgi:hypothetical protein
VVDEARIDELFLLPPEEFTPARDRLAKEATEAGDREGAGEIKALRRPTVAAWAVNAAVRRKPDLVAALLETATRLRTAQRRAASGLAAQDFREATAERRRLVRLLTEEAGAALAEAGRSSESHVAAAGRTFEAAASEQAAAEAVRAGRLSKELSPSSGFDVIDAFAVIPGAAEPAPKEDRATTAARRQLAAARREIERQTRRAATAREELRAAEREASEADQAVRALEHDLDRARRRAEEARRRADRAGAKAERAERALEEAESKAAEIEGGATGAR